MVSQFSEPQSICILRLSAIGDVCHAVATVQAIQKQWPNTKITWVIGRVEKKLVNGLSGVNFVEFEKYTGLAGFVRFRKQIKHLKFDILLNMQGSFRASLISTQINAVEKWGFNRKNTREGQWLFTNRQIPFLKTPHVAEGFLAFAKAIGVGADYQLNWKMPVSPTARKWCEERLAGAGRYIIISPSASKPERNWLTERYAEMVKYSQEKGFAVVICGGPSPFERELAEEIEKQSGSAIINLVGETDLQQMLALLEKAELLIAPDTGPAHMAVTVQTPVIGLYVHSNPERTGPYLYRHYVVSHYEALLKAQTGKSVAENSWGARVKGIGLMEHITVEAVKSMFDKVIEDTTNQSLSIHQA
ncbi:glycosyltransferase family 9 protein [Aliikangiella marina]|uniref:Glycosyltransferase family 9 protein n=1 Tax=Aliikangiella marina TaxID=1712262 RepID=A0A545TGX8_9GAMM|nr:glycosyltransferase family 9 protein [Aliikangiella marina]TQV76490.1 glycosyltransferase family 9 protein [Aliikangiella marina]